MEKEILEVLLRIEKLLLKENLASVAKKPTPFPWGLMSFRVRNAIKRASVNGRIDKEFPLSYEDLIEIGREKILSLRDMGEIGLRAIDEVMIDQGFPEWLAT